jgi:hypothetical protein
MYKTASRFEQARLHRPSLYERPSPRQSNPSFDDSTGELVATVVLAVAVGVVVAAGWVAFKTAKGIARIGRAVVRGALKG